MAQAQKLVSVSSVERFASFVGQAAQFNPEILDKLDGDKLVDVYGENRHEDERFIDTVRRIGIEPFKERVYAAAH